jgi:hypothetical protein
VNFIWKKGLFGIYYGKYQRIEKKLWLFTLFVKLAGRSSRALVAIIVTLVMLDASRVQSIIFFLASVSQ